MPLTDSTTIATLDAALRATGTAERAASEKKYLRSNLTFYGATVWQIRAVVKDWAKINRDLEHGYLVQLVETLWESDIHEHHRAACEILELFAGRLLPDDIVLIERMLRTAYTWAYVDELAATVTGGLVERHPELISTLDRWSRDKDFWLRRSAMLAFLIPLREGRTIPAPVTIPTPVTIPAPVTISTPVTIPAKAGIQSSRQVPALRSVGSDRRGGASNEGGASSAPTDIAWSRFARYADSMLEEKEFFIRKAIGWVLRDTSKKRPQMVLDYLLSCRMPDEKPRAAIASGLTFKESTRQLPADLRAKAEAARTSLL